MSARRSKPPTEDERTNIYDSGSRQKSQPIQVTSMKTPGAVPVPDASQPTPAIQRPKLRAISEVTPLSHAQPRNLGNLAPPRDAAGVRARRLRDYVILGSLAVVLASVVALAIWFLGR